MVAVLSLLLSICTLFGVTASSAKDAQPERHAPAAIEIQIKDSKKSAKHRPRATFKKNRRPFDPTDYLSRSEKKKKATLLAKPSQRPTASTTVNCRPRKVVESECNDTHCKEKKVRTDDDLTSDSLLYDRNKLTKEVIESIKTNCMTIDEEKPALKPVFDIGIKDISAAGEPQKKAFIPRLGFEASF